MLLKPKSSSCRVQGKLSQVSQLGNKKLKVKLTSKILNLFGNKHTVAVCFSKKKLIVTDIMGFTATKAPGPVWHDAPHGFLISSRLVVLYYNISFSAVLKERLLPECVLVH